MDEHESSVNSSWLALIISLKNTIFKLVLSND